MTGAALVEEVAGGLLVPEIGAEDVEVLDDPVELVELEVPVEPLEDVVDDRPVPIVRFPEAQPESKRAAVQPTTSDAAPPKRRIGFFPETRSEVRINSFWPNTRRTDTRGPRRMAVVVRA
jgi:hypothetical protein